MEKVNIGVDIGGMSLKAGLVNKEGKNSLKVLSTLPRFSFNESGIILSKPDLSKKP